jgi:hypothetical protein
MTFKSCIYFYIVDLYIFFLSKWKIHVIVGCLLNWQSITHLVSKILLPSVLSIKTISQIKLCYLYNLTSKTATINIAKYILNIRSCSPIICQISDQFLKLVLQLLRKNINCSSSINKNDKSCFKWYISRYIFQNNCVNIYDRLCFLYSFF